MSFDINQASVEWKNERKAGVGIRNQQTRVRVKPILLGSDAFGANRWTNDLTIPPSVMAEASMLKGDKVKVGTSVQNGVAWLVVQRTNDGTGHVVSAANNERQSGKVRFGVSISQPANLPFPEEVHGKQDTLTIIPQGFAVEIV